MSRTVRTKILHRLGSLAVLAALLAAGALAACDRMIYDYEGDCSDRYFVRFLDDRNMLFADAFASRVRSVTLHLIDADGRIVWQKTEQGDRLAEEGYMMETDVAPGTYSLLAWACGKEEPTTFRIGNDGRRESLCATFDCATGDDGLRYIGNNLDPLFHGYAAEVVFRPTEGGIEVHDLPLVKNTNHLAVVLQQTSGEPLDKEAVCFEITDDNAMLNWDNEAIGGHPVIYRAWHKASIGTGDGEAGGETGKAVRTGKTRTDTEADVGTLPTGVVAELTTSRLLVGNRRDARLRVYRSGTQETIVSIRLIDALLLVKGYYNRTMSDQEYLDRQDEYSLTFFLDANHRWLESSIVINSWRVVLQNEDLN